MFHQICFVFVFFHLGLIGLTRSLCNDGSNPCQLDPFDSKQSYFLPINGYHCLDSSFNDQDVYCTCPDRTVEKNRPCRICHRNGDLCGNSSTKLLCIDINRSFACLCSDKSGQLFVSNDSCDFDVDNQDRCQNQAVFDRSTRRCHCPSGFYGQYCEHRSDKQLCERIECLNRGFCAVRHLQSKCLCQTSFDGDFCQYQGSLGPCPNGFCLNGAQCYQNKFGSNIYHFCRCQPGWMGPRCQKQYFQCQSEGLFIDPLMFAQGKYFLCHSIQNQALKLYEKSCPKGLRFNNQTKSCLNEQIQSNSYFD